MVKNHGSLDERIINPSNGKPSHSRMLVLEALEAQGAAGATVDEIEALIGQDLGGIRPKGAIGQALSRMEVDEYVVSKRGRWYLKEHAPQPPAAQETVSVLYGNGTRVQVAPLVQKRTGKAVSIFTSPREMTDVVKVVLVIKGQSFPIPLWDNMWICYGQTTPDWDAEKEQYYNVETIELLMKNGKKHEEHPAPSDTVTIAQG